MSKANGRHGRSICGATGTSVERRALPLGEVAGQRPPDDRDVDVALRDRLDDPGRRDSPARSRRRRVKPARSRRCRAAPARARAACSRRRRRSVCTPIFRSRSAGSSNERMSRPRSFRVDEDVGRPVVRRVVRPARSLPGRPMTRSHSPAFSVLRKKPRRCAHQVYSTVASSSRATSSAILFSNPSQPLVRERQVVRVGADAEHAGAGARVRACRGVGCGVDAVPARARSERRSNRQSHEQRRRPFTGARRRRACLPSSCDPAGPSSRRRSRAPAVGSRGSSPPATIAPAQPPTPERIATYCLPSGPAVGDRLADDPGAGLELPQQLAGARVDRLEPAVHRAVEDDVARRRQRAAPDGKLLLDLQTVLAVDRIPGGELAAVAARARRTSSTFAPT